MLPIWLWMQVTFLRYVFNSFSSSVYELFVLITVCYDMLPYCEFSGTLSLSVLLSCWTNKRVHSASLESSTEYAQNMPAIGRLE